MTVGRIPWSRVRQYAREVFGWQAPEMLEGFWILIASLDIAFGEWMSEEHDRSARQRETTARAQRSAGRSSSKRTYSR